MTKLVFDRARDDDWPSIWHIFRSVIATGDTYPYPPDMSEAEARALWMKTGDREATYLARHDGVIVATAYVRATGIGAADHIANAGWMVAPYRQGLGIGRAFAGWVLDRAIELGYHGMQFNSVVATNTGAIALWESLGFEIVGTVPDAFRHPGQGLVPVHVMYRHL